MTTSARRTTTRRAARVWSNRENCEDFERSKLSNSISNRSQGMIAVNFFRWPCYQIHACSPVDVWSNHACQVPLFFPGVRTACQVGLSTSVLPRPQKMHPSAAGTREPTGCAMTKRSIPVVLLSLDWARNAPYSLDKVRVREGAVGPSFSQTATSSVPGYDGN